MQYNKIALLNIQHCNSHGAVLLAYALERILIQNGYSVQNLDYKYAGRFVEKNIIKRYIRTLKYKLRKQFHLTYIGKRVGDVSVKTEYDIQSKRFRKFRQERLHLTREIADVHDTILKDYDIFIVGSDVVWKPEIMCCEDRELYFLLTPSESALKIAYAASIGTDDTRILSHLHTAYQGAFDALDYISIREQSMIPFIKQYTQKDVISVIDPVFLLSSEDYRCIENNEQKKLGGKEYVYVYLLSRNVEALRVADNLAKEKGLGVLISLNDAFEDSELITVELESAITAGPAEFLYNIRNASFVISDSFHATAFSIIFNKPFWVFKRGAISVRMADILDRFHLNSRMYQNGLVSEPIPWHDVNQKIEKEKGKGMEYLLSSLKKGKINDKKEHLRN